MLETGEQIRQALKLVGALLLAEGERYEIVVIGGAAMNLRGIVARVTTDVDIVGFWKETEKRIDGPPEPLPGALQNAARTVARELRLGEEWLNGGPADLVRLGLPEGAGSRLEWEDFGGLRVGVLDPSDLIPLKLYAASYEEWTGRGKHIQDLIALRPTRDEFTSALRWVRTQDPSEGTTEGAKRVIEEVLREIR